MFHPENRQVLCRECLLDAFSTGPNTKNLMYGEYGHVCDVCNSKALSVKIFYRNESRDRLHFCTLAWNWDHVCATCARQAILTGREESGRRAYFDKKWVSLNESGLPVVDGKVVFPKQ
jgi:hypothetical protein